MKHKTITLHTVQVCTHVWSSDAWLVVQWVKRWYFLRKTFYEQRLKQVGQYQYTAAAVHQYPARKFYNATLLSTLQNFKLHFQTKKSRMCDRLCEH